MCKRDFLELKPGDIIMVPYSADPQSVVETDIANKNIVYRNVDDDRDISVIYYKKAKTLK